METLLWVCGVVIALGGAVAVVWPVSLRVVRLGRALSNNGRRVVAAVSIVERELQPNGGGSLRDMVQRIDWRVGAADAWNRALVEHHGLPVWEADASGEWMWCSRGLCLMFGAGTDRLYGMGWVSLISPDDRDRVVTEWRHAIADRRDFRVSGVSLASGSHVTAEAFALRDHQGALIGFLGRFRYDTPDEPSA